jgi:NAD(P)-dependent dehydrogenase (short-subunit alcohol dehydrogenase family)
MPKVLITGANRGIGLEFVRQYGAEGWDVIACCRDPGGAAALRDLAAASGGKVTITTLDVLDHSTVEAAAETHRGEPIDVVINNAGIPGPKGDIAVQQRFGAMDYEAWVRVLRTNTLGPMKVAEAFAANVAASVQKKIVHISSTVGSNVEPVGLAQVYSYGTSKAALNKMATLMAEALRARGVTVLAICPGHVKGAGMGGPSADVELSDSIAGMRKVIGAAALADTGGFRRYNGETIEF